MHITVQQWRAMRACSLSSQAPASHIHCYLCQILQALAIFANNEMAININSEKSKALSGVATSLGCRYCKIDWTETAQTLVNVELTHAVPFVAKRCQSLRSWFEGWKSVTTSILVKKNGDPAFVQSLGWAWQIISCLFRVLVVTAGQWSTWEHNN